MDMPVQNAAFLIAFAAPFLYNKKQIQDVHLTERRMHAETFGGLSGSRD